MITFRRIVPGMHVSDMERALEFWVDKLGFVVAFTNGDPVSFAIVNRDEVDIHIEVKPEAAGHGHCHIVIDGVDDLHEFCLAAGITVQQPPRDQSWGLRDMLICDPDGNTLEIGEPVQNSATG